MAKRLDRSPTTEAIEESKKLGCSFVMLGHGRYALIDSDKLSISNQHFWYLGDRGYVCSHPFVGKKQVTIYLHRLLMVVSQEEQVDHIDRNKLDNRLCNLRKASPTLNTANAPRRSHNRASRFKGVRPDRHSQGKFDARIGINGHGYYIGVFKTEIEAALAYNAFASLLFGEFACLNQL